MNKRWMLVFPVLAAMLLFSCFAKPNTAAAQSETPTVEPTTTPTVEPTKTPQPRHYTATEIKEQSAEQSVLPDLPELKIRVVDLTKPIGNGKYADLDILEAKNPTQIRYDIGVEITNTSNTCNLDRFHDITGNELLYIPQENFPAKLQPGTSTTINAWIWADIATWGQNKLQVGISAYKTCSDLQGWNWDWLEVDKFAPHFEVTFSPPLDDKNQWAVGTKYGSSLTVKNTDKYTITGDIFISASANISLGTGYSSGIFTLKPGESRGLWITHTNDQPGTIDFYYDWKGGNPKADLTVTVITPPVWNVYIAYASVP